MSKVFMIIGKSFSGKDYLLNNLLLDCKTVENDLIKLVPYTTRKQRPNEKDGIDYSFIDDNIYETNFKNNEKCVISTYDTAFGEKLHYILDLSKLQPNKNYILVGNPEWINKCKKILGDDLCLIYLVPPNWALFNRFSQRNDNELYSEFKYKEIYRRFLDDLIKFGQYSNEYISNCNSIINFGEKLNIDEIKYFIKYFINHDDPKMGILLSNNSIRTFNTNYQTSGFAKNYSYQYLYNILSGKILLCNESLILYTEEEKYELL